MSREKSGPLYTKNIHPPLSVMNQNTGFWQDRKKEWISLGIESEIGRENIKTFNTGEWVENNIKSDKDYRMPNISIFDPFLCELAYQWFSPKDGIVLDPFCGGSVRGIVSSYLDRKYIGIDLSERQIEANKEQIDIVSNKEHKPNWIHDDSLNLDNHVDDNSVDFIFSCPPYHDLEVYTDDERDLSRMSYDKFMDNYRKIIHKCYSKLKDNRFAGFVITELRDPKTGGYKNFLLDTITAFEDAGFVFYNDIILIQTTGTKALVAQKLWDNNRKITRRHQNFLLFIKGDGKKAKQDMSDIERINLEGSSLEEFYVG